MPNRSLLLPVPLCANLISERVEKKEKRMETNPIENVENSRVSSDFLVDPVGFLSNKMNAISVEQNPTKPFTCEICFEQKPLEESFNIKGCSHFYCAECMVKYVDSSLQGNVSSISCPDLNCTGVLEPEYCRAILPQDLFERWGNALCEAVIQGSEKFYCPFNDCSALLIQEEGSEEVITQSECPHCNRLFCAVCKVSWHSGLDCWEFQALNKEDRGRVDLMMMELARDKNWRRCGKCKFYVEKSSGCTYMKCRCGFAFCYNCGAPSIAESHLCPECKH